MIKIINDNGRIWCIKVDPATKEDPHALVSFFDCRYEHTEYGQFVSSYRVSTLLEHDSWHHGLCLHGGVADWCLSGKAMERVVEFLESVRSSYA